MAIMAIGEPCVMIILITQQQKLFAISLDMDAQDTILVTDTPVVDSFGWITFGAMDGNHALKIVNTTAGALTTAVIVKMFQFRASTQSE